MRETSCGYSGSQATGNEFADRMAKEAAAGELYGDSESRRFQSRTSMDYLKRRTAEAKTRGTKEWIVERTNLNYIPPKKPGLRKELREREEGDRVKVLLAADGACLDRTIP